jgi:hypothetical protein
MSLEDQKASKAERELYEGMLNYELIFQNNNFMLYVDRNNKLPDFVKAYLRSKGNNLIEIFGNISQDRLIYLLK